MGTAARPHRVVAVRPRLPHADRRSRNRARRRLGRLSLGRIEPDDLYALPLEEFTAARNALAKELKSPDVKALKKPSRAAWTLNQLARSHPRDVDALLRAGDKVRDAQTAALRGDASKMREAGRDLAEAVDHLLELAGDASAAVRDAIAATLRAAATEPAAGELLKRGVLVSEIDPSGFGLEGAELPPEIERRKVKEQKGPDPHLVAEAERAEARARRLTEAAGAAETRAKEARLAAEEAEEEARAARARINQ
jgi:hypothetical protein